MKLVGWLGWAVAVTVVACGGSSDTTTGSTGPGTAGAGGGSAGSAGTGGSTAGKAGTTSAGTGGSTAGTGGSTAGTGGSTAGTGGSTAGTGGSTAGTGGSTAGTGGSTAGTGGSTAGTGGSTAGTGGSTAGTGGSTAGAAGSTAGAAGSAGATQAQAECAKDEDCVVQADCCACAGVPAQPGVQCTLACAIDQCAPLKLTAKCAAGRCVTSANCDIKQALCKSLPPTCPKGQTPTVDPMTQCWGPCIAVDECESVPTCQTCLDAGQICVQYSSKVKQPPHCQPLPAPCTTPTCDCVGPAICDTIFSSCGEDGKTLTCACPTC